MSEESQGRPKVFRFDASINLGTIITVATLGFGGIWFMAQSDSKLKQIDTSISEMKGSIDRLSLSVNSQVERIDRRIDFMVRQSP